MVFGEGARGPGRVALRQAAGVKQASLRHQGALVGRLPVADTALATKGVSIRQVEATNYSQPTIQNLHREQKHSSGRDRPDAIVRTRVCCISTD